MRSAASYGVALALLAALVVPAVAAESGTAVASRKGPEGFESGRSILPPAVTERYEYYDIAGDCEHDLQCELKRNGVPWSDGRTYDALTTWDLQWNYELDRTDDSCSVGSFQVAVDILFRYPRWVKKDEGPPKLVEKWEAYMSGLVDHENGHRDMAIAAAEDLTRTVAALAPAASCGELKRTVRKLCRQRMKQLEREAKRYDEATNHGGTQGAVLE